MALWTGMLARNGLVDRQPASVRFILRDATADLHERIDSAFAGPFDTDAVAYGHFLARLGAAILPLERMMEDAGVRNLLPDWRERRRSDALTHDLAALDIVPPPLASPPAIVGEAALFGAAYVLEGSRLGGKVLLRRVLANPDARVREATSYLRHGSESGLWQSFVARLEASAAVKRSLAEAVAGARAAFGLFDTVAAHA